jgi:hypothetical protein
MRPSRVVKQIEHRPTTRGGERQRSTVGDSTSAGTAVPPKDTCREGECIISLGNGEAKHRRTLTPPQQKSSVGEKSITAVSGWNWPVLFIVSSRVDPLVKFMAVG